MRRLRQIRLQGLGFEGLRVKGFRLRDSGFRALRLGA